MYVFVSYENNYNNLSENNILANFAYVTCEFSLYSLHWLLAVVTPWLVAIITVHLHHFNALSVQNMIYNCLT